MAGRDVGAAIAVTCVLPDAIGPAVASAVDAILRDMVTQSMAIFAREYHDEAETIADTGALAQSFGAPTVQGTTLGGSTLFGEVVSPLPYAIVQMDTGRRAGAPFPPLAAIALWAQRKLGLPEAQAQRAAFPIARAIAMRGLPSTERASRAYEAGSTQVEELIDRTLDAVETAIAHRFDAA